MNLCKIRILTVYDIKTLQIHTYNKYMNFLFNAHDEAAVSVSVNSQY